MAYLLVQFVLIALLCGLGLWALNKWESLDGTIKQIIQIAVYVVLGVMFINLLCFALTGQGAQYYIHK